MINIDREEYHLNYHKGDELFNKLKERIFLKTELDIVYTDITNWERNGLLEIGEGEKGDWKKLNYIEYVWLCIISDLRDFGFSYKNIIEVKLFLFHQFTAEQVHVAVSQIDDNRREIIDDLIKSSNVETPLDQNFELMSVLEVLLEAEIIQSTPTSILVSKDRSGLVVPISKDILKDYINTDVIHILDDLFEGNFCSISLSKIANKFFVKSNNQSSSYLTSILSSNEKKLLKIIRKQSKTIKKITVIINEGEMDRIEVTSLKKVQLESRLLEHIKKGDYQKITIDTVDGNIVNFENTEKIKL